MEHEALVLELRSIRTILEELGKSRKESLSFKEGCQYLQVSPSYLYKRTSTNQIPHSKPGGKLIYFTRKDLDEWILRNRHGTDSEIQKKVEESLSHNGI